VVFLLFDLFDESLEVFFLGYIGGAATVYASKEAI
jgi:hypothetical protein